MALGPFIDQLRRLLEAFAAESPDPASLQELLAILDKRGRWPSAGSIFNEARQKRAATYQQNDPALEAQYLFEEACAKSIYNLSGAPAPYDPDSLYWILSRAIMAESRGVVASGTVARIVTESTSLVEREAESAYRKQGIELLPELRDPIQLADSPTALWIEVTDRLGEAYEHEEVDLIDRIYAYADWCLGSDDLDVSSAAAIGFYEHLPISPPMRADMPNRFSSARFQDLKALFGYLLDEKGLADLEKEIREADRKRDWWKKQRTKDS